MFKILYSLNSRHAILHSSNVIKHVIVHVHESRLTENCIGYMEKRYWNIIFISKVLSVNFNPTTGNRGHNVTSYSYK